jgi:hypothetical protein
MTPNNRRLCAGWPVEVPASGRQLRRGSREVIVDEF